MTAKAKRPDVLAASADLRKRTLTHTSGSLDCMIYIASMRDYNTGLYVHQGLAARFSPEAASEALADCHQECFQELISLELKDLTEQLDLYMRSTGSAPHDFLRAWKDLEPYRVAVPGRHGLADGAVSFLEPQDRFGNPGTPKLTGSGADTSRIATAVTCPTISASSG